MAKIFAYIEHKNGVADDTALELLAAARQIDAAAPVTAIVAGKASEVDAVASEMAKAYNEVWTFAHDALAYPNAEALRPLLVKTLPAGAVILTAHDTFGMDLAPGLSIKLDAAFVPDVVAVEGMEGSTLKLVRQEFGGQVSTHVTADIAGGAVLTPRAGSFQPAEAAKLRAVP